VTFGSITRRRLVVAGGAALCGRASWAQPGKGGITIAQIFDSSAEQQDVSKDFLIGSRAFWQ